MRLHIPAAAWSADAWILDCDGTLVDSMPAHHRAWQSALRASEAPFDFSWDLFMSRAGMSLLHTVSELNAQFGTTLDPARVERDYQTAYDLGSTALGPVEPVVEACRTQVGLKPMAVASGSRRQHVQRALEALEIASWFDFAICAGEVLPGKPAPDVFLRCAERLAVRPERCVVFEDAELGLLAAERAGMGWVAVDNSGRFRVPPGLENVS